jgi:predicted amidohydrolase YtcJ
VRVQLSPNVNSIAAAEVLAKSGIHTGFGDDFLKLGAAKMYADGAPSAKTAAVYTPAEGEPGNLGLLIWKPEALHCFLSIFCGITTHDGTAVRSKAVHFRTVPVF